MQDARVPNGYSHGDSKKDEEMSREPALEKVKSRIESGEFESGTHYGLMLKDSGGQVYYDKEYSAVDPYRS